MVEKIMIKQNISCLVRFNTLYPCMKKKTILIIRKKKKKKKIVCFLVFDNMFSTCFNEKGENTEKKIIFLWHPNNEIFSCTYALLKKNQF